MDYRQLGDNSDLKVSRIGLGTWAIGGWMWGGRDEKESIDTIHAALDRGVTLIDTAPVYGFGSSEEIVGQALKKYGRRDRICISTKAGLAWDGGKPFRNKVRSPSFCNLQVTEKIGVGQMVSDLVALVGSLDIVLGEIDR